LSLESYCRAIPKAELHVHLEGSLRPATLLALARRHNVDLPATTEGDLARWFQFRDFDHFSRIYGVICECLRDAADFERVVYDFGAEMARQNVRYAEVSVSAARHRARGVDVDTFLPGINRGRELAKRDFGVEMRWIFTVIRRWDDQALTRPMADYVTDVAVEARNEGVVALGLAGAEEGAPPEPFEPWFDWARTNGLHSAPHAGEMMGAESVWGAIRSLGAERIAHGVRAVEDAELVEFLAGRDIALDVCPRSNVCLGVYPGLGEHPLGRLFDAGATITINSDDPPMFGTTLSDEVETLPAVFGLGSGEIDEIVLNGVRYSFLRDDEKSEYMTMFRREMDELKDAHLTAATE